MPDRGRDAKGGVPLPKVSLEPAGGAGGAPGLDACRELQAPYAQPLNDLIAGRPAAPDPTGDGNGYPGRNPPRWRLFENLCGSAVDVLLDNEDGEAFHPDARGRCGDGPGFLSNRDIAYVFTGANLARLRRAARAARARAHASPTRAPGRPPMPSGQQLRYWSFCQYEPATQRVIACRSDDRVAVGAARLLQDRRLDGRTAAAQRPPPLRGHLAAVGAAAQGLLIYRHMLAGLRPSLRRSRTSAKLGREREVIGGLLPGRPLRRDSRRLRALGCSRSRGQPSRAQTPRLLPLMAPITVSARSGPPEDTAADTRVVAVFEDETLADPALQRLIELGEAKRGLKKVAVTHEDAPGGGQRRVLIAGLGSRADFGPEQARVAAAAAAARAKELGAVSLSWAAPEGEGVAAALVEGTLLKLYSFDRFKSKSGDDSAGGVESLEVCGDSVDGDEVERGRIAAVAANAARDLQNLPAQRRDADVPRGARKGDRRRARGARGRAARPRGDRRARDGCLRLSGPGQPTPSRA